MPYGVTAQVRTLAGNPTTAQVSDATIDTFIDGADSLINTKTGKSDWAATDTEYESLELISDLLSASMVLEHYRGEDEKAKRLWDRGIALLDSLVAASTTVAAGDAEVLVVVAQGYRTSPLKDSETSDLVEP